MEIKMNIVCGTDFSVHANEAALASAALAAQQGGTLSLMHVLDTCNYSNPSTDFVKQLRDSWFMSFHQPEGSGQKSRRRKA